MVIFLLNHLDGSELDLPSSVDFLRANAELSQSVIVSKGNHCSKIAIVEIYIYNIYVYIEFLWINGFGKADHFFVRFVSCMTEETFETRD